MTVVPDRAGLWWRVLLDQPVIVQVELGDSDDGRHRYRVNDDGRWRGPVLTPDEVATLRAELDAMRKDRNEEPPTGAPGRGDGITDNDSATGHDRAPDRYMAHGRETIDRQRDAAYDMAEALAIPGVGVEEVAGALFMYLCTMQVLRYHDRLGLKGNAEEDKDKAKFYLDMIHHLADGGPDPRSSRPGFTPYQRQPFKVER